jgi:hypothetical protein
MFAVVVYTLCAATSGLCSALLLRGYSKSRARLLFWSGLCFAGLALNNVLLIIDVRVVPTIDLSLWRTVPALIGISLLVYGLVWETR